MPGLPTLQEMKTAFNRAYERVEMVIYRAHKRLQSTLKDAYIPAAVAIAGLAIYLAMQKESKALKAVGGLILVSFIPYIRAISFVSLRLESGLPPHTIAPPAVVAAGGVPILSAPPPRRRGGGPNNVAALEKSTDPPAALGHD
jgi:hypothetical protein